MGVLRTSRLSPPTVTQRRRKSSALSIHGAASVVDEAKPLPSGEERETVQHALVGDSNALTTLFARDRAKLYRTAFSLLRNKEDAEDALQDGLLSAYVNLRSFEGRSRFSTWLVRVGNWRVYVPPEACRPAGSSPERDVPVAVDCNWGSA